MRSIVLAAIAACALLGGCTLGQSALITAGVDPARASLIATDTAVAGQLFCTDGVTLLAVAGVNVKGASAASVAEACRQAQAVGALTPPPAPPVPVPAPPGATAVVATTSPAAAALVKATAAGT